MFDDFEEFEKNHVPDLYERKELYKMAAEKFNEVFDESREIQEEYKRIKGSAGREKRIVRGTFAGGEEYAGGC